MADKAGDLAVLEGVTNENAVEVFKGGAIDTLLAEIRAEVVGIKADAATAKGRKEIKLAARKVASAKVRIDGFGKKLVEGWKEQAKAVDVVRKHARDTLTALQAEVLEPVTKWDEEEKAREEAAALALQMEEDHAAALEEEEAREREKALKAREAAVAAKEAAERAAAADPAVIEAERIRRGEAEARAAESERLRLELEARAAKERADGLERERVLRDQAAAAQQAADAARKAEERVRRAIPVEGVVVDPEAGDRIKPGWSVSKLESYDCPFRFYQLQIQGRGLEEPRSEWAVRGSIVSDVLADVRVDYLRTGADHRGSLFIQERVQHYAEQEGLAELNPDAPLEVETQLYDAIKHMELLPDRNRVARWWVEERLAFTRDWQRVAVNEFFQPVEPGGRAVWFRMRPDLAFLDTDNVLHVWDDKSGWGDVTERQVKTYAFALCKVMETEPREIRVRYNLLAKRAYAEADPVVFADVAGFPQWLDTTVEGIKGTTEWGARLCKACAWCGFKRECPLFLEVGRNLVERGRLPDQITREEDAQRLGAFLAVAEKYIAEVKAVGREYVEKKGAAVVIPGTGLEMRTQPSWGWDAPMDAVVSEMLKRGVPAAVIRDRSTMGKTALERIVKGATPLVGTAAEPIDPQVRQDNVVKRAELMRDLLALGKWSPRRSSFGVFKEKEG